MKKIIGIFLLISNLSFSYGNYYLSEKIISNKGSKYQSELTMDLIDEKLPNSLQLEEIFSEIKNKNKLNKNFFIYVGFPIKSNSEDIVFLYLMKQMQNEKLEIVSLRQNIEFSEMVINDQYKDKIGAINYNEIVSLKKGIGIQEIIERYGEPFNFEKDTYSYLILSKGNKIIATLYLEVKDNKLDKFSTFSIDESINKKELESLLEGKIKKPKFNTKQLNQ